MLNKFLIALLLVGGFVVLYGVGNSWKLKPETKYNHALHTGELAVVTSKAGDSVWMALDPKDCYPITQALARKDTAFLSAAASNKTAFAVPVGTTVKVLGQSESRVRGEITDGPSAGKQGWVEFEFVRPRKAGEFR